MVCNEPAVSFHLHANFFDLFPAGTQTQASEHNDMVTLSLLERHILEFTYKVPPFTPGPYMFHSHDAPGEMGMFGLFNLVNAQAIPGLPTNPNANANANPNVNANANANGKRKKNLNPNPSSIP